MSYDVKRERLGQNQGESRSVFINILTTLAVVTLFVQSVLAAETSSAGGLKTEKESRGRKFFARLCAECHADDASGDDGPDLRGLDLSDQKIRKMIMQGRKGEMPAFKKLDDEAITSLISYLRTLKEPAKS
jgi:mono/diheme cytochrome c family protein